MPQTDRTNRRIVLAERPKGRPDADTLRLEEARVPEPGPGEMLVRTRFLSLDPYMRGRMNDTKSYAEPVAIGGVMTGQVVGEVVESNLEGFDKGDTVLAGSGWQDWALSDGQGVVNLGPDPERPSWALGVLGMPGYTAYAGLLKIGEPRKGETVVVAAATGPVGSAVGQIARIKGARAVGIAGGEAKRKALTEEFGFDAALDHRSPDFAAELEEATPDGVDVYFENVGGPVGDAVFRRLNTYARVPVCGLVAGYNATEAPEGPDRLPALMGQILSRSLTVRGFIQDEFTRSHGRDFVREMTDWVADGSVRYREDVVEGLQNAPEAFRGLLTGKNFGKLVVKVS